MNPIRNLYAVRREADIFILVLSLCLTGLAQAQDAPASGEEGVIELSPFLVDAGDQNGYLTTSTLAGTRTKTRLIDIGSAVSVVTSAMLEDAGATDINDVLAFLPNAEGQDTYSYGGESVNGWFASAESGVNIAGANAGSLRESGLDRTRGLGKVDVARDFFVTKIPFDAYNVESVTMIRGPNSILFGLGSPAGVLD